jgi:hypothetical protein
MIVAVGENNRAHQYVVEEMKDGDFKVATVFGLEHWLAIPDAKNAARNPQGEANGLRGEP